MGWVYSSMGRAHSKHVWVSPNCLPRFNHLVYFPPLLIIGNSNWGREFRNTTQPATWARADLRQIKIYRSRYRGATAEGVGQSQRLLWVQAWIWDLFRSRPEPGPLWVWDKSGNSNELGLSQDLCDSGCESGTSEGIGLSQDLCGSRHWSGTSEGVGRNQKPLWV